MPIQKSLETYHIHLVYCCDKSHVKIKSYLRSLQLQYNFFYLLHQNLILKGNILHIPLSIPNFQHLFSCTLGPLLSTN